MERKKVPAAQALLFTLQRLSGALAWLEEIEKEWHERYAVQEDGSDLRLRSQILTDASAMYISTLAEKGGNGHSLVKSYSQNSFVDEFIKLPIVKKCQMNRNNRSGHESKAYGHSVSPDEILDANLRPWVNHIEHFLVFISEKLDSDPPASKSRF